MSWPEASRRRALAAAGALGAGLLAGCGFRLRRPLPLAFRTIAFAGFAPRSPQAEALRRALPPEVALADDPARAEVVLQSLGEGRERSVVAQTAAALVREVQLRARLVFLARTPSGRELLAPVELMLARDMTTSETAALAKQTEEAETFRVLEADIAAQVMRRLAAIRL